MGTIRGLKRTSFISFLAFITLTFVMLATADCFAVGYQPIRIEPSRVELTGKPGQSITGSVTVTNKGVDDAQLTALVKDWSLNTDGEIRGIPAGTLPSTLSNYIKFNPRSFVLKKGSSQTVRFSIKVPQNVTDRELRGLLVFEQSFPVQSGEASAAMAKVQIATTLYVGIGSIKRSCEPIKGSISNSPGNGTYKLKYSFKGTGTGIYKGVAFYALYRKSEFKPEKPPLAEGSLGEVVVLPDSVAELIAETKAPLTKGTEYIVVIRVEGTEGGTTTTKLFTYAP